jgi:ribonuclease HIII
VRGAARYRLPERLSGFLRSIGATATFRREIDHGTQYGVADRTDTVTLNVFSTGKVVVQGKKDSALRERVDGWLRGDTTGRVRGGRTSEAVPDPTPRVGTDEAGKGEYFGPLVVAGVRVLDAGRSRALLELGVRDSKTVANVRATALAAEIGSAVAAENVRELTLSPREYEERRSAAGSVQRLLGELHAEILRELEDGVEVAIVDSLGAGSELERHAPPGLRVVMRPRAEDDVAVAAASVVARARYLEEMNRLSGVVGFELPRGSTHVRGAVSRVYRERGMEGLRDVAKVHFSITEQVLRREKRDGGWR